MMQVPYRREVLEARRQSWLGSVSLSQPLGWWALTAVALVFAVCLLSLLFIGTYSKRVSVSGYLLTEQSTAATDGGTLDLAQPDGALRAPRAGARLAHASRKLDEARGALRELMGGADHDARDAERSTDRSTLLREEALTALRAVLDEVRSALRELEQPPDGHVSLVRPNLKGVLSIPEGFAGSLREGDQVQLRFSVLPHRKSRPLRGRVVGVVQQAGSAESPTDSLAVVEVGSHVTMPDGHLESLRPGMQMQAVIVVETRRLYEWVFEPLYSAADRGD